MTLERLFLVSSMATAQLPPPAPLNLNASDISQEFTLWLDSYEIYALASGKKELDDAIQRATFLHCLGPPAQRVFQTLPGDKSTLKKAIEVLQAHFTPKRNIVSERYKFRLRAQNPDESIENYITSLRELVKTCQFDALEEDMLRDQIVEKCYSKNLREKLLNIEDLTLQKTLRTARLFESAQEDSKFMSGTSSSTEPARRITSKLKPHFPGTKVTCYRCGKDDHKADKCGAKSAKCLYCSKIGHLARVCLKRKGKESFEKQKSLDNKKFTKDKPRKGKKVNAVVEEDTDSESSSEFIFMIDTQNCKTTVRINGHKMKVIIDTGCERNIISSQMYNMQFRKYKLEKSSKRFLAYGQKEPLVCLGFFEAEIVWKDKLVKDIVYVIQGNSESLLGRKSAFELGMIEAKDTQIHKIKGPTSSSSEVHPNLENLVEQYEDLFHGLGKVVGCEHKVTVDESVKPIAQRL